MRKTVLAMAGAAALTIGSAAGAAVTVDSSTNLSNPAPSVTNNATNTTINFGQSSVAAPITATLVFTNTLAGLYNITLGTSTPGFTFSNPSLVGPSPALTAYGPWTILDSQDFRLNNQDLVSGQYTLKFDVNGTTGGAFTGNLTISPLPEPATWAMMLLGFGAIGLTVRSRRKQVLAQIA
ncbi:MAG TPA: FxDxF family PEP-CTERM protein [Sphingomicrobium sp.]|nr:FxDxF family PEP-CTERM protein [Sphingomicrobium sp.]